MTVRRLEHLRVLTQEKSFKGTGKPTPLPDSYEGMVADNAPDASAQ